MLGRDSTDRTAAKWVLRVLQALTGPNFSVCTNACRLLATGVIDNYWASAEGDGDVAGPRWWACFGQGEAVLVCHGTDTEWQVPAQIAGYLPEPSVAHLLNVVYPYSWWAWNRSDTIWKALVATQFITRPKMWFCGHSAGAGIANLVAYRYLLANPGAPHATLHGISFGENKSFSGDVATVLNPHNFIRYMNDGDPVPALPQLITTLNPALMAITPSEVLRLSRYTHQGLGRRLEANGAISASFEPSFDPIGQGWDLTMFMSSWLFGNRTPHLTSEYLRRLTILQPDEVPEIIQLERPRGPDAGAAPPAPPPQPIRDIRLDLNAAATAAVRASVELAGARGTIIPSERYRARRRNGQWAVYRADRLAVISNGKRAAKRTARALNRVEANSQPLGIVVPSEMPGQDRPAR